MRLHARPASSVPQPVGRRFARREFDYRVPEFATSQPRSRKGDEKEKTVESTSRLRSRIQISSATQLRIEAADFL
jgi:hypothetical protein